MCDVEPPLRRSLAPANVRIDLVDEIPLTPSGKRRIVISHVAGPVGAAS
jgi:hypothetical protein